MSDIPAPVDTIAAVATPSGRGGVGIVRVSGPCAAIVAAAILGRIPAPRHACVRNFVAADGTLIDHGLALFFRAPASSTGEDVLELHGHGGPVVMDRLLARVVELGARLARPGEFTERAFLNDKLDLAQAEAVADLIDAASMEAAAAAARSLQGAFSERVHELVDGMIGLRTYVEAAIDFPEEEIDFLCDRRVRDRLDALQAGFRTLSAEARQGCLMREGMTVAIAGRPNVGKSSLLNRLAGVDAAIVTAVPGTTRDVLRERIAIDGLPLNIIDTAGLRETTDVVESEGVRRARAEIARADRVLLLVDDRSGLSDTDRALLDGLSAVPAVTVVRNKCDLSKVPPAEEVHNGVPHLRLSALTGAGVELLRAHLKACMGYRAVDGGGFIARRRHLDALARAEAAVARGRDQLERYAAGELLAQDLFDAQRALGEITGAFTTEDLLGRIFASFCIGK